PNAQHVYKPGERLKVDEPGCVPSPQGIFTGCISANETYFVRTVSVTETQRVKEGPGSDVWVTHGQADVFVRHATNPKCNRMTVRYECDGHDLGAVQTMWATLQRDDSGQWLRIGAHSSHCELRKMNAVEQASAVSNVPSRFVGTGP